MLCRLSSRRISPAQGYVPFRQRSAIIFPVCQLISITKQIQAERNKQKRVVAKPCGSGIAALGTVPGTGLAACPLLILLTVFT